MRCASSLLDAVRDLGSSLGLPDSLQVLKRPRPDPYEVYQRPYVVGPPASDARPLTPEEVHAVAELGTAPGGELLKVRLVRGALLQGISPQRDFANFQTERERMLDKHALRDNFDEVARTSD